MSSTTPTNNNNKPQSAEFRGKSGKKICCACPDTKKLRDECVVTHGEEACKEIIDKHKLCLRQDGFNVQ